MRTVSWRIFDTKWVSHVHRISMRAFVEKKRPPNASRKSPVLRAETSKTSLAVFSHTTKNMALPSHNPTDGGQKKPVNQFEIIIQSCWNVTEVGT